MKLEVAYYSCVFFWFNAAIILSDIVLLSNVIAIIVHLFVPSVHIPFTFDSSNIYIAQLMLFNWLFDDYAVSLTNQYLSCFPIWSSNF